MSIFSGKCDIYDCFVMIPDSEERALYNLQHTRFFIDEVEHHFETFKELTPYYPCIAGISAWSGGLEGSGTEYISSVSYADEEDAERISTKIEQARKIYRKLKRSKKPITAKNIFAEMYSWSADDRTINEIIATEVCNNYEGAYPTGVFSHIGAHMRDALYQEMIRVGYTEKETRMWVYEHIKTWKDDTEIGSKDDAMAD